MPPPVGNPTATWTYDWTRVTYHALAPCRVYRFDSPGQWVDCGQPGNSKRIFAMASYDGDLSALAQLIGGRGVDIEGWLATQDAAVVVETLTGAGIPAAVVVSPSLVTENPQLRHRGFLERLEHPRTGAALYPCPPFARLGGTGNWLVRTPPTLGQHNNEVLTELCGVTETELDRLAAATVIGTRPKGL